MLEVLVDDYGLNINQIAAESGLHQPTVHRVYSGDSASPKESTFTAIREVFERYAKEGADSPVAVHWYEVVIRSSQTRTYRLQGRSESAARGRALELDSRLAGAESAVLSACAPAVLRRTDRETPTIARSAQLSRPAGPVRVSMPGQERPADLTPDEARDLLSSLLDQMGGELELGN